MVVIAIWCIIADLAPVTCAGCNAGTGRYFGNPEPL